MRNENAGNKKHTKLADWFRNTKTWKKVVIIVTAVVLISGGTVTAYVLSKLGDVTRHSINTANLSIVDVDGYTNILLLGVDARDINNLKDSRSDAIMIVSINDKTKDVKLVSIYRDTFLKMGDTETYDKITHACFLGGPEMSIKSINQALDLNISNYIVFNFKTVSDLVDSIGGIEVDVKEEEIEQLNKYALETAKIIGYDNCPEVTSPGKQKLAGPQAVSYGRIRKGVGDDFKRTERMRLVLSIVVDKLKSMNVSQLDSIIDLVTPQVQTTLSNSDIISLGLDIGKYKINGSVGFPYNKGTGTLDGVSYVYPIDLEKDVQVLHSEVFGQKNYKASDLCSEISGHVISSFANNTDEEQTGDADKRLDNNSKKDKSNESSKPKKNNESKKEIDNKKSTDDKQKSDSKKEKQREKKDSNNSKEQEKKDSNNGKEQEKKDSKKDNN